MNEIDFRLYNSCIRHETSSFSAKQLQKKLQKFGNKISIKLIREWLKNDPNVFQLDTDLYVTKAGCFTGREFGIKPSKYEIEHKILIIGDRCVPFVDGDIMPHEIKFIYGKKDIKKIVKELQTSEIIQHHKIFGEENFLQYIMFDPVNEGLDFSVNGFELPSYLKFTVLDMTEFYNEFEFKYEDWITARVISFGSNTISFEPDLRHVYNPFEQSVFDEQKQKWNKVFEEHFEKNLKRFGPRSCIEEQLMYHFVNSMQYLSVPSPGCVEEFLKQSEKIGFSEFGVETRLWILNDEISDSKNWNEMNSFGEDQDLSKAFGAPIPTEIINAYIYDALFKKEEDASNILSRMYPEDYVDQSEVEYVKNMIKGRFDYLKQEYNWFIDYEIAPLRELALEIFHKSHLLYKAIETSKTQVEDYPQQDLITFIQLYSHIKRMIESLTMVLDIDQSSINAAYSSLDGMSFTFDEVKASLNAVLKNGPWNRSL